MVQGVVEVAAYLRQLQGFQLEYLEHVELRVGKSGKFVASGTTILSKLHERCDCREVFWLLI